MKRLLDYDPITGTRTYHEYDHHTRMTTITTEADVASVLEHNKETYKDPSIKATGMKNDMLKIASIPVIIIEKWKREDGLDVFNKNHRPALMRKLNDPAWRYLRTASGKY